MSALRLIAGILSAVLLMMTTPGCEDKIKPSVLPGLDSKTIPQQESWNSTIVVSDSGHIQARILAGYIQKYDGPQETQMSDGITVFFYNDVGKQTSVMTARTGKVNEQTYSIEAEGDVLVVSDDSTKLRTERLFWDNKHKLVHTNDYVSVTSPRENVQGRGFESDQRLRNYRIFKVTAQVRGN
ncbi:MAG: LPS export ABC transporter periplasmic protein LptC [Ignavibacteriales bacterium]|nr:LPS export ABC transporter periplasmic protein LptC [Ignavibacteriales bacterium]